MNKKVKLVFVLGFFVIMFLSFVSSAEGDYRSDISFASSATEMRGITIDIDGNQIALVNNFNQHVYLYDLSTKSWGDEWDVEIDGASDPFGIATDAYWKSPETYWVTDNSDPESVYEYDEGGVFQGSWELHTDNAFPRGITTDGDTLWVIDGTDDVVYSYDADTNATIEGKSLNVTNDNPQGITTDGTYIWIVDSNGWVFKYNTAFTYLSSWQLNAVNGDPRGITQNGTYFWVTDAADDYIYVYEMYDMTPPSVTINAPENRTYYNYPPTAFSPAYNVTAIDDDSGMVDCNQTYNNLNPPFYSMSNTSTSPTQWTRVANIGTNTYTIYFVCWDERGNINDTEHVTFTRDDSHSPSIIQQIITDTSLKRIASITKQISQPSVISLLLERTRIVPRNIFQSIILMRREKTYDFSGVFTSQAFNKTVGTEPPLSKSPAGETEFTSYTEIASSDDTYYVSTNESGHVYHKFEMEVKESAINYIDVSWEGHTSSTGNVSLWVWDYTLTNWSLLDSGTGATDFTLSATITNLNDVRQGTGNITFLVQD